MHIYAADVSALAESVAALTVVGAVATWVRRTSTSAVSRLRRRRHEELVGVLSNEVASGPGWDDVTASPEVSLEAGVVRGHEKVPACGQVEVLAGGQLKVPTPRSPCRPGV